MSCSKCSPEKSSSVAVLESAEKRGKSQPTIALVGNPNVGKSTLFNLLTGARQKVMNAPGTTVYVACGQWRTIGASLLDLPGTYSLVATSPDEQVVVDTLAGEPGSMTDPSAGLNLDLVLVLLDGSSMTRSLYLLAQVAQTGLPAAAVVTMMDVAQENSERVNIPALAQQLGIPVMSMDPRKRGDYALLDQMIVNALHTKPRIIALPEDPYAPGYRAPQDAGYRASQEKCGCANDEEEAEKNIVCGCAHKSEFASSCKNKIPKTTTVPDIPDEEAAGRLSDAGDKEPERVSIVKESECSGTTVGNTHANVQEFEAHVNAQEIERATVLFEWVDGVEKSCRERTAEPGALSRSDRIDRVLLSPVAGLAVFFTLMWALFKAAGEWVGPLQDRFEAFFASGDEGAVSVANGAAWLLEKMGLTGGWFESFLLNGILAGLGVVASFFPLMFVIYAAISLLEDSGYMARAAFLGDRLMRMIGLDGRVILPLIMGFGCNLPSLAAARTLPSARQRLVTVLITPYTSCAARLTIYLMIARIFFKENVGNIVFLMYALSVLFIVLGAWILKFFVTRDEQEAPLMLILPAYQMPRPLVMLKMTFMRSWSFVTGAGKIIVMMTVVVWLMGAVPVGANAEGKSFADPELAMEDSLYGKTAQALEPVFSLTGFGEWHMTGALMTGFVAKETVVSSIVTSYNLDEEAGGDAEDKGSDLGELPQLVSASLTKSAGEGYQGLAALAFLVFVLAYTPCMATVAEQAKLIGGRRTALAVVVQLAVAWVLAVALFQVGKLFL